MRVFGKQVSNLWLLLLLPIAVLVFPLMLPLIFVVSNLAGAIIGPPAIWNRPSHSPAESDLVGRYVETKRVWDGKDDHVKATLELRIDGTMIVRGLPDDRITNVCNLSGTWRVDDQVIDLNFISDGTPGACGSESMAGNPQIAGRSSPYKLYWVLGDPDSGTGLWLTRQ